MKKMLLIACLSCAAMYSFAQNKDGMKFSVGAELGFASGGFSNTHSIGIGGSAQLEIPLQDKLNGVAYGGILMYNGKAKINDPSSKNVGQTIIPLRVGVKYFLTDGIYGSFQAGLGFFGNFVSGTAFSYSPQIGYEFKTKSGKAVDATVKYDAYAKSGTKGALGFRLAYVF